MKGKIGKYFLRSGLAIAPRHLKQPTLVKRGERVAIQVKLGKIHVKTFGKAMKSGGFGDMIPIQNGTSKRVVEGKISGPNEATVIG